MITPRFLTLVLGYMSIPITFNESIMTLERCLLGQQLRTLDKTSYLRGYEYYQYISVEIDPKMSVSWHFKAM